MARSIAVAGISLLTVALLGAGCSQAAVSPAAGSLVAASADASEAPSPETTASPSAEASDGPTSGVPITFEDVATKRWGAEPFKVKAVASSGARIKYTAKGSCTVRSLSGLVEIKKAGDCVITAKTTDGEAASASLTIPVRPATSKITFKDDEVRYERPFSVALKAKASPSIPLTYTLVAAGSGDDCKVSNGKLTLTGFQPTLTTDCRVRVAASKTSPNYETPEPVMATIHVDFPAWDVEVPNPDVTHSFADGSRVEVTVRERSGDALGITVEQTDSGEGGTCSEFSSTPRVPDPGTTRYVVVIEVSEPGPGEEYTCDMTATALPPDYFDPGGTPSADFTVTVVP